MGTAACGPKIQGGKGRRGRSPPWKEAAALREALGLGFQQEGSGCSPWLPAHSPRERSEGQSSPGPGGLHGLGAGVLGALPLCPGGCPKVEGVLSAAWGRAGCLWDVSARRRGWHCGTSVSRSPKSPLCSPSSPPCTLPLGTDVWQGAEHSRDWLVPVSLTPLLPAWLSPNPPSPLGAAAERGRGGTGQPGCLQGSGSQAWQLPAG